MGEGGRAARQGSHEGGHAPVFLGKARRGRARQGKSGQAKRELPSLCVTYETIFSRTGLVWLHSFGLLEFSGAL